MSNHQHDNTKCVLPSSLNQQLLRFRKRLRLLKLVETLLAAVAGILFVYLTLFTIERFVTVPAGLRLVTLIVATAGFSIGLPWALRKWFWNTRRLEQVARLLRGTFPVLGDEVLSVIEMADNRTGEGASQQLVDAATEQTGQRVAQRDLFAAAKSDTAKKRSMIALAVGAVAVALMLLVPAAASNSWLRMLNPWTDASRYTFTQLGELPDEMVVPYGEAFQVDVPIMENSQWKPASGAASIGAARVISQRTDDNYQFSLPALIKDAKVNVTVGDDRKSVDIKPMTRPELNKITLITRLPEYLQHPDPITETSSSGRLGVLRGSEIELNLEASRELESASLDNQPLSIQGQYVHVGTMKVNESSEHTVNWRDRYNLLPKRPIKLEIKSVDDQAPSIVFEQLENPILLQDKAMRFDFSGRDDFGILKLGIEWVSAVEPLDGSAPVRGEKLLIVGDPRQRAVSEQGIFTPKLENIAPQTLTLRLFVEDYKPGRGRVYSRPQTLQVMSYGEHAAWIKESMQRWKSSADAVYQREVALAEENKALRDLNESQQMEQENVRRLENQIAAERDNAERLENAVEEGSELIREALMNESMRAEQVANWAESLQQLREIAENDMPSLAQQLNDVRDNLQSQQNSRLSKSQDDQSQSESSENKNDQRQENSENEQQGSQQPADSQNQNQNQNESDPNRAPEDSQKSSGDQSPSPETLGSNRLKQTGKTSEDEKEADEEPAEEEEEKNSTPSLQDNESSMLEPGSASDNQNNSSPGFGLPQTNLMDAEREAPPAEEEEKEAEKGQDGQQPPQEPSLDGVVDDQEKFLEEFKKARDSMDKLMGDFENSTFVKRFKSASRNQLDVARQLNRLIPNSFGIRHTSDRADPPNLPKLTESQTEIFEKLRKLQKDLKAYQAREPGEDKNRILSEMNTLNMLVKLGEIPKRIAQNRLGDSVHRTEFWADTFDRWGEELVPPSDPNNQDQQQQQQQQDQPKLPPAIVLELMRQVDDEMTLRDETRNFDQTRKAMPETEQRQRNDGLTVYQMAIQERSLDSIDDIQSIPNSEQKFGEAIGKVKKAAQAMNESSGMLFDGTTGESTLAAESAAIEALLASQRIPPPPPNQDQQDSSDGTDGSESLGGEKLGLANLMPDLFDKGRVRPRDVGAATSANLDNVPERFRAGLDSFTNKLGRLRMNRGN